jgi:hypothetical protein
MDYTHTEFQKPSSNNLLVVAIKPEIAEIFRMTAISVCYIIWNVLSWQKLDIF